MKEDVEDGWWGVPTTPDKQWKCPECGERSPIAEWAENRPPCEDCGDHDGRECPKCHEVFDHVWGDEKLARAQRDAAPESGK